MKLFLILFLGLPLSAAIQCYEALTKDELDAPVLVNLAYFKVYLFIPRFLILRSSAHREEFLKKKISFIFFS